MKHITHITALAAALTLAACGSDESSNSAQQAEETAPAVAAEQDSMMDKAQEVADTAMEKASEMAEALKLDTSSLDSFKSSLAAMKDSLSGDQADMLTSALGSLAKDAAKEEGGLMGAAKDLAAGKSMEETLYEKLGSQLNGMTFDDILKLAG